MMRTSQAQSFRSCHLRHSARQRFPVVRSNLSFVTGFAQRAASHAERGNLRQCIHSFFMMRTSQAQSFRSCHLWHRAQQRFPVVRACLSFFTDFAQRAASHAERGNLRQRIHSFFMMRTSQAQSFRRWHLWHRARQRFPVVCACLSFLSGFAQRAASHAERANWCAYTDRQRLEAIRRADRKQSDGRSRTRSTRLTWTPWGVRLHSGYAGGLRPLWDGGAESAQEHGRAR